MDIEGIEEENKEFYMEQNPAPLRNRHTYKTRDEEEMEKNIEFLYDRKKTRKVLY